MKTNINPLTEELQELLADHIASELHDSLVKAAEERYMNEVHSYHAVKFAIAKSVKLLLWNIFKETNA